MDEHRELPGWARHWWRRRRPPIEKVRFVVQRDRREILLCPRDERGTVEHSKRPGRAVEDRVVRLASRPLRRPVKAMNRAAGRRGGETPVDALVRTTVASRRARTIQVFE